MGFTIPYRSLILLSIGNVYLLILPYFNAHVVLSTLITLLTIYNSLVCKVDLNHSCFSPGQVVLIPLLTLLNIRNSLVCMVLILSVMGRHIVKAFAIEPWMFYLGNFYLYFYFVLLSFLQVKNVNS